MYVCIYIYMYIYIYLYIKKKPSNKIIVWCTRRETSADKKGAEKVSISPCQFGDYLHICCGKAKRGGIFSNFWLFTIFHAHLGPEPYQVQMAQQPTYNTILSKRLSRKHGQVDPLNGVVGTGPDESSPSPIASSGRSPAGVVSAPSGCGTTSSQT